VFKTECHLSLSWTRQSKLYPSIFLSLLFRSVLIISCLLRLQLSALNFCYKSAVSSVIYIICVNRRGRADMTKLTPTLGILLCFRSGRRTWKVKTALFWGGGEGGGSFPTKKILHLAKFVFHVKVKPQYITQNICLVKCHPFSSSPRMLCYVTETHAVKILDIVHFLVLVIYNINRVTLPISRNTKNVSLWSVRWG
jgi:hypothetical protein